MPVQCRVLPCSVRGDGTIPDALQRFVTLWYPRRWFESSRPDGTTTTAMLAVTPHVAVALETEQTAMSHRITLSRPLRMRQLGETRFAIDGTPVDCVYVGLHHRELLPARPAVVVSGINHGANLGSDVFYSGTIAAARE